MDAPLHVSFVGTIQRVEIGERHAEVSVYHIAHLAPDLTRRWYMAPRAFFDDVTITRGDTTYAIRRSAHVVIESRDAADDDQPARDDDFSLLTANYRPVAIPSGTIDGRTTRAYALVNRHTGHVVMRIWTDAVTHLVLRKERYASDGALESSMHFEQIRYVRTLPAALFALPQGMPIVERGGHESPENDIVRLVRTAGFPVRDPRYLPEGFLPVMGDLSARNGIRTLHLFYSDGVRALSLFESPGTADLSMRGLQTRPVRIGTHPAVYASEGPLGLLAWSDAGVSFTLIGDLALGELERIAASLLR